MENSSFLNRTNDEEFEKPYLNVFAYLWYQWKSTSEVQLANAETRMLQCVKAPLEKKFVQLLGGYKLWTIIANKSISDRTPLVLITGFGSGVGFWALNFDALSKKRPVYAFDLLGFGRSSRPKFQGSIEQVEETFIESIEEWRKAVSLPEIILLGYSFGGYLASCYALKHPEVVKKLILAEPWGFPETKNNSDAPLTPFWLRLLFRLISLFNPLTFLRATGPFGPSFAKITRPDFKTLYADIYEKDEDVIFEYLYHLNAGFPSGEIGFSKMANYILNAKKPMLTRIGAIRSDISITFIYAAVSWMDTACGYQIQEMLSDNEVDVFLINDCCHQLHADKSAVFHKIVDAVCDGF